MKMLYNGKIQFYYLSGGYKALSTLLPTISIESFMIIVANLFNNIVEVKNNGFLSCQNIDISFDKVFVDPTTLKVYLVYIPVRKKAFDDYPAFENELRTSLVKIINNLPNLANGKVMQFAMDLTNGTYSLEDLYNRIKGVAPKQVPVPNNRPMQSIPVQNMPVQNRPLQSGPMQSGPIQNGPMQNRPLRMVAMNAPTRFEIIINKPEFTLGKNPSQVDGVITFNKAISRVHCKITQAGGQFFITDLGSVNGTYVNKVKLMPNQSHPINNGDIIRLANSDFQISVG
jgi:hypothetical protein